VRSINLRTFAVAHQIIGGGEEGDKQIVETKEEADHSLPYMLAIALIDGEVQPRQYAPERIGAADVQKLLRKVTITPDESLSTKFPRLLPADLEVKMQDGTVYQARRDDYHGFYTSPFDCTAARAKFDVLVEPLTTAGECEALAEIVASLDERPVAALTSALGRPHSTR
jgi:2-methylcitrate dehydratase